MNTNLSVPLKQSQVLFSAALISRHTKTGFTWDVDIKQIRRANMEALIRGEKNKSAFARKVGTDPAYISQLLSTKTKADIGHTFARAIETAYDLPHGWMDREHNEDADDDLATALTAFEATYRAAPEAGRKLLMGAIEAVQAAFLADHKQNKKHG